MATFGEVEPVEDDETQQLREQITILKAERDEARNDRDDLGKKLTDLISVVHKNPDVVNDHGLTDSLTEAVAIILAGHQANDDLHKLAKAFESAMMLVKDKVQAAYVSAFLAGRVMDERVDMKDTAIMQQAAMDAMASFGRFMERERKQVVERQRELQADGTLKS
jgi:hypothetical protein